MHKVLAHLALNSHQCLSYLKLEFFHLKRQQGPAQANFQQGLLSSKPQQDHGIQQGTSAKLCLSVVAHAKV
jgi:hypothetical protein